MKIIQDQMIILIPEDGYMLADDTGTYSDMVFLGVNSSPDEWHEVLIEEVPHDE